MTKIDSGKRLSALTLCALLCATTACGDDGGDGDANNAANNANNAANNTNNAVNNANNAANNAPTPPEDCDAFLTPSADDQSALQGAFIDAAAGSTVCLSEGTFSFVQQLTLGADDVTIRGAGPEATVMDFTNQDVGANGIRVTGDRVTFEDLQVLNTPGDGIRADEVEDITFRGVHVIWEAESSTDNGAYGLYPVGCVGVLIEGCLVVGARDAGIYVGQSQNIIVRDNEARGNVAGIEIENSLDAVVHNNHSHDNTGGILIFDLPDLDQFGARSKVFDNLVENNNRENFAPEGNIVARVPVGTGLFILASDDNEVHNNTFKDNDSFGVAIVSFNPLLTGAETDDPNFDIFPQGNWVHDNVFENNATDPDTIVRAIQTEAPFYDIAWDGCEDPDVDNSDNSFTNCLSDNGEATYINFNLCGGANTTDAAPVTCQHTPLPESP